MTQLYEGKAKQVFSTENPNEVIIRYKDDATAFNAQKKGTIVNKGVLNNKITSMIYAYLAQNGVPTHLIKVVNDRDQLCKKVEIVLVEVIVRNILAGSTAKLLGISEGLVLKEPIFEICYKKDELGDPLINDCHAIALGLANREELDEIYRQTAKINQLLIKLFDEMNIKLVDFKIEFGRDENGKILLADEISPDTCRLWDKFTNEKLDKDRFRRDLGNVEEAYETIFKRISDLTK